MKQIILKSNNTFPQFLLCTILMQDFHCLSPCLIWTYPFHILTDLRQFLHKFFWIVRFLWRTATDVAVVLMGLIILIFHVNLLYSGTHFYHWDTAFPPFAGHDYTTTSCTARVALRRCPILHMSKYKVMRTNRFAKCQGL